MLRSDPLARSNEIANYSAGGTGNQNSPLTCGSGSATTCDGDGDGATAVDEAGDTEGSYPTPSIATSEYGPISESVGEALRVVARCHEGCDSFGLIENLRHVSESFGYRFRVRRSEYHEAGNLDKCLRNATLECPTETSGGRCTFRCRLVGMLCVDDGDAHIDDRGPGESDAGATGKKVRHEIYLRGHSHNHPPSDEVMRNAIPMEAMQEAVRMRNTSYITCRDIIRHIEDKYGISLQRNRFRRNLAAASGRLHPTESDCNEMIASLIEMKHKNEQMHFNVRLTEDGRVHSVMWVLPQWREDYVLYGIMPGVSMDCKSIANAYDLPLIAVTGRTGEGQCCIFGMGFLATQCEGDIVWFLRELKKTMPAEPNTVTTDQDMAFINACRKVFPTSFQMLDEWHLNQNQIRNVSSFLQEKGSPALHSRIKQGAELLPRALSGAGNPSSFDQMTLDIFSLRRSSTPTRFEQRRAQLQSI